MKKIFILKNLAPSVFNAEGASAIILASSYLYFL
jgi:hypothetical protein